MKYDWILIGLYLLVLVVVARELFSMIALAGVIILLMIIVITQKIGLENMIKDSEKNREKRFEEIIAKVDAVSAKTDGFKDDFNRQIVFVDSKVSDVRHFVEIEISNAYKDLSQRLSTIEEKLGEVRQVFSAAVGSLDERVQIAEQKDEQDEVF